MKKELKDKWCAALRSGEYQQGQGSLHFDDDTGERYCCLGVLADIAIDGPWENYCDANVIFYSKQHCETELNTYFLGKLELSQSQQQKLVEMNDEHGSNFKQIADWVEANL